MNRDILAKFLLSRMSELFPSTTRYLERHFDLDTDEVLESYLICRYCREWLTDKSHDMIGDSCDVDDFFSKVDLLIKDHVCGKKLQ